VPEPWWKSAVIYQIYPRSFADTGGDGVGDLRGIADHLDHLAWLGVDAIWLSPIYPSPMADFGYDVSDYCDIDPTFGTLADFDDLLERAHAAAIKVIVDWVPNHTSDQHPWFVEARSSRQAPKRDWYVWRDGDPATPPNNWRAAFSDEPAWTWDAATEQWYLRLFLAEQPDLNWANPEVVEAMHGVLRFWLDRGVDGFRMDVIHALGKDPALPDWPDELAGIPASALNDHESTHGILRDLRRLLDGYPGDRMMVGEVYLLSTAKVAKYYGAGDELHLAFNFPPLYAPWEAGPWKKRIDRTFEELDPIGAWPTWVLSNHDNPRHRTRYGGSEARARAAAVLLLTMRGTPFLFQGEEFGLEDAVIPPERVVDPGGRDGCRAPIPWTADADHGWSGRDPWLPWPPEPDARNAATLAADSQSILHLYRRLLALRRASPALRLGSWQALEAGPDTLAYRRAAGDDERVVILNYGDAPIAIEGSAADTARRLVVQVASDGRGEGRLFDGTVAGSAAVVLGKGET
jgi:alpha-glucosidase